MKQLYRKSQIIGTKDDKTFTQKYLIFKAIWHEKINTAIDPCELSDGYVFQNCIYRQLMAKIGCQPFWLDYIQTDLPKCTDASQLSLFVHKFLSLNAISSEKELMEAYNCLRPCKYMEYMVRSF